MITPTTMSSEDVAKANVEELVAAYMADGLDRTTAEAYAAARNSDFFVD